jgi:PAS domain S-box-containing protein
MRESPNSMPQEQGDGNPVSLNRVVVQPLYSGALVRLVAVFGVVVSLFVAGATGWALWAGRQEALAAAASVTSSLARSVAEAVSRSFNSIDVTLASVSDLARDGGLGHVSRLDLRQSVSQRLALTPHLRQVLVVGGSGLVLFDSADVATGKVIDVSWAMAEHQRVRRPLVIGGTREGRFIGAEGPAGGRTLIPVSRAVTGKDGAIVALVLAAVNPDHFRGSFDAIEGETGTQVQLWRFDGVSLSGVGAAADLPLFRKYLKNSELGTFTDRDRDGIDRVTSYRTTMAWPVVVTVDIPVDQALANWRTNAAQVGWPVGLVTLATLGLTLLLARNLAQRGKAEAALRLSDRVLANVSNGVTITDASAKDLPFIYVNHAFETMTGYKAAQALGRNGRFLHAADPDQPALDLVREAIANGQPITVKLRNFKADHTPFWNRLSITPVRNGQGDITHWVGVLADVTQEEEARVALASAYDDVARYNAELERFSFVLAHHLQEPARQMRLQAQLLGQVLGDREGEPGLVPIRRILDASVRLIELLRDVQSYMAIERQPPPGGQGSSRRALEAAREQVLNDHPGCGLEVVVSGELPKLALIQKRLDELFLVLLDNAVVFRHPERAPRVTISVRRQGAGWVFTVADNGIGIDSQYFERIFVPLERLGHGAGEGGTGIGLAVAKKIVEAVHGRIWVESDGESGSTFFFVLPGV